MSSLLMDGFELGTTPAEFNTLSGLTMSGAGLGTVSLGASTMGQGRSLQLAATTAVSPVSLSASIAAATLNGASRICVGWRAKLNSAYNAPQSYGRAGFGASNDSNLFGPYVVRNAANSLQCFVTTGTNSSVAGTPFNFPDYNAHYLTFVLTQVSGSTYTQQFYIDRTLMMTNTVVYTWQADNPFILDSPYTAGTAGLNRRAFSEIDDLYVSINEGPLGDLIIYRSPGTADVQAQWTRYGGSASDAAATDRIDLATTTGIRSNTAGAADLYSIADPSSTLVRRRIYAAKTTVYGTGDGSATVSPTQKSGSTTVTGAAKALSVFGDAADTGWDGTLANTPLANFQFGVTRS